MTPTANIHEDFYQALQGLRDSISTLEAAFTALYNRTAETEKDRDALATVISLLRPHSRDIWVHVPGEGSRTFGEVADQACYREILKARENRIRRQIWEQVKQDIERQV